MERRRIKHTKSFDERLADQAERLRKQAKRLPPGIERDDLIRRARQSETASHINEWLTSRGWLRRSERVQGLHGRPRRPFYRVSCIQMRRR